jgi:hypothetical protein
VLFAKLDQLKDQVEGFGFGKAFETHHELDANITQSKAVRVGLNCLLKPDCRAC